MIIVDTTVWIDYRRGAVTPQADWLDANLLRERLGLTDLILCEVLQGVKEDNDHVLLHSVRDFDPFEQVLGLAVIRP